MIVKCKNIKERKGRSFECGRHLMKVDSNGDIHIPCPVCGYYAIVTIEKNKLIVVHVNKQGEREICQI